jgi:hypothetical protein
MMFMYVGIVTDPFARRATLTFVGTVSASRWVCGSKRWSSPLRPATLAPEAVGSKQSAEAVLTAPVVTGATAATVLEATASAETAMARTPTLAARERPNTDEITQSSVNWLGTACRVTATRR